VRSSGQALWKGVGYSLRRQLFQFQWIHYSNISSSGQVSLER